MVNKLGVSIVICCYNSAARLPQTLHHLASQKVSPEICWEVIVVDNASTDNTAQIALELWPLDFPTPLRVVREPQPGLSFARRRGFEEAQYEFVSFVDDDNWVANNWVETVYEIMISRPEVGACGGRSTAAFEREAPDWFETFQSSFAVGDQAEEEADITESRGWLWGAGLNIRKTAWEQLVRSGFQFLLSDREGAKLSAGGDNELCYGLRLLGWRLYYSPKLELIHFIPKGRITWKYLCQLKGQRDKEIVITEIYQNILNNKSIEENSIAKLWFIEIRRELTKVLKRNIRNFDWLYYKKEGNLNGPIFLARIGKIRGLLLIGPSGYARIYQDILCYQSHFHHYSDEQDCQLRNDTPSNLHRHSCS